jgi:glycosyltransferase involved in cell wall biosynthesis
MSLALVAYMHVVFVSTMSGGPWGGSEELWSQTAFRLRRKGEKVSASVMWWPQLSPKLLELEKQGAGFFIRKPPARNLPARLWRKLKGRFLAEERKEFQWLRSQRPDLVVISQGGTSDGVDWMDFCSEAGLPFVSIVQCNAEGWYPDDRRSMEMARAYGSAKKVFCVSRHNLKLLERQIGEKLPNASVVWNPYNVSSGQPPAWPKANGVWKIACVARLDPAAKGQDLLFQVLAQKQWRERPVEINLFGSGICERNLQKLAGSMQLKNVRFRGHVPDVKAIWEENHLLVLPSRLEGLPLALVESMWCARPAVVTDVGGNAELSVDEETGFVAAAPVLKLFEQALERAWNRRSDWRSMGMLARARAEELIPKDPVENFCGQLTECLAGRKSEIGK